MGMMVHEVARIACQADVISIPKVAGEVHDAKEILKAVMEADAA